MRIKKLPKIQPCRCGEKPGERLEVWCALDCEYVYCYRCHTEGPPMKSTTAAINAWNRERSKEKNHAFR